MHWVQCECHSGFPSCRLMFFSGQSVSYNPHWSQSDVV